MAYIELQHVLPATPDVVWDRVLDPKTLQQASFPILTLASQELPERWDVGSRAAVRLRLAGWFDIGWHHIEFQEVDAASRTFRTLEHGDRIYYWKHQFSVVAEGAHHSLCRDRIEFDAPEPKSIYWFSQLLYRSRYLHLKFLLSR